MNSKEYRGTIGLILTTFQIILFSQLLYPQEPHRYLSFDGVNDFIDCGYAEVLRPSTNLTISTWIKTEYKGDWQAVIWCGSYYENHYAIKITPDNKVRGLIWINGPQTIFSETTLDSGKWYDVAMTYNSSDAQDNFKLYINGNLEAKKNVSGEIGADTNPFIIGIYPGLFNQPFKGSIAGIQLWNRALSQEEIQEKMDLDLNPNDEQGLVGYWPANEGEGDILHDLSGNGNNGAIYGAEWYPSNSVNAVINTESVWLDINYDGHAAQPVSAAGSTGEISSYSWTLGGDTVGHGINPEISLPTGSNYLVLTVRNDSGAVSRDSVLVSVYASKLNTNGEIYSAISQLDDNTFFIGSLDDMVYQFDSLGNVNWTYLTGGDIQSTVTVSDTNNVFVTSSDTRLYSFNSSGAPNWDKAIGGIILSSPTIDKNYEILVGLTTGRLVALAYNSNIRWSLQTGGSILASPVVNQIGTVYFGSADSKIYAVNRNGDTLWTYKTLDAIESSPALSFDQCIVIGSTDGYIYKLNENGKLLWKFDTGGGIYAAPVIGENGQIFIGSANGYFYSISDSGTMSWSYNTHSAIKSTASLSADGSTIFFGDEGGNILALSAEGKMKWYLKTDGAVSAPTLITGNGLLYTGSRDGSVYILKDISNSLNKKSSTRSPVLFSKNLSATVLKNDCLSKTFCCCGT